MIYINPSVEVGTPLADVPPPARGTATPISQDDRVVAVYMRTDTLREMNINLDRFIDMLEATGG